MSGKKDNKVVFYFIIMEEAHIHQYEYKIYEKNERNEINRTLSKCYDVN